MAEDNMDVATSNSHSEVRWDNLSHQSTGNTHRRYKILCLSNPERKARPSKAVKEKLKEMGLGRQDIQISSTASATEVKAKFEEAYPKLVASCGFHILIQDKSNPSELVLVECNLSAGYNGQFLHDNFKRSICYIRPRTSLSNSSSEAFVNPREEQESNYIDPAQQGCSNLATRPTAADLTGEYQETALPSHADHPNSGTEECSVTCSGNDLAESLTGIGLSPTNTVNNEVALLLTSFVEDGDQSGFSEFLLPDVPILPQDALLPALCGEDGYQNGFSGLDLLDDPTFNFNEAIQTYRNTEDILGNETSSCTEDFSLSDDQIVHEANPNFAASVCKTSSDTGIDATQSDEQLFNEGKSLQSGTTLVRINDESTCGECGSSKNYRGCENISAGSVPKSKKNEFWGDFICRYLAENVEAQECITLTKIGVQCFLHFSDIKKISSLYGEFKQQNGCEDIRRDLESRKKILKDTLALSIREGSLKISASGEDFELEKEYIKFKILDDELWRTLTRKYSVRKKPNRKCENGETSSDTGLGLSDDHSVKDRFNELALYDASEADGQKDPLEIYITPEACSVEVQSTFNITANQDLPEGLYFVMFGKYGICNASGDGHKCLQGEDKIRKSTRKETHDVTVTVYDVHLKEIGHCLFTYIGTNGNANKQKVPSEDQSSIDRSVTPNRSRNRRKSSNESLVNATPSKRSRPSDMPVIMYVCDKMAKSGDENFFRALIRIGHLADVLATGSEYFNSFAVTAQEHGHRELAELIVMSSRNPSHDCLTETLTLEKLIVAVQAERSLEHSDVYDFDDDSDSSLSGYNGDSEDDELSSNADSDDDDTRSCILPQESEMNFVMAELDSLELGKSYEILEFEKEAECEIIELEPETKEKNVTKFLPSIGVGKSSFGNKTLDDIDKQAVETEGVENKRVPTSSWQLTSPMIRVSDQPDTGTPKPPDIETPQQKTEDVLDADADDSRNRSSIVAPMSLLHRVYSMPKIAPMSLHREFSISKYEFSISKYDFSLPKYEELDAEIERERERKRQVRIEKKRKRQGKRQLKLEMSGSVNVLGQWESRNGRWEVRLMNLGSGCGLSLWQEFIKSSMISANNSLICWSEGQCKSRNGRWTVSLMNRGSGCGLSLWQEFIESGKLSANNSLVRWSEDGVDEEQSNGAKGVKKIALAFVRIGDEAVVIKVEFVLKDDSIMMADTKNDNEQI